MPLASVFLWISDGVSTCVRRRGERGETLGEDQCDSGMKEPKISFYFPTPSSLYRDIVSAAFV